MDGISSIISKSGLSDILDFVYPSLCLVCNDFVPQKNRLVCIECWNRIDNFDDPFCMECHEILTSGLICSQCGIDRVIPVFALGQFVDPLREIIHQFKYGGYQKLGRQLAEEFLKYHQQQLSKVAADFLIPIPLHSYRQKSRGFNQAAILSDIIGEKLDIPVDTTSLMKIRRTKDQAKLKPLAREKNIAGAFAVEGDRLIGKRIIIVDDVMTTGATIQEAMRVCREAGAKPAAVCAAALAGMY